GSIPKATVREYKAKKEWLDKELSRMYQSTQGSSKQEISDWRERIDKFTRDWFMRFGDILHRANTGPMWMQDERVAEKVADSLHRLDGDAYNLDAFSVMSNHVHPVFKPFLSEQELEE